MEYALVHLLVIVVFCVVLQVKSQSKVTTNDDGTSGSIKFTTPDLNDEESHSPFMPDLLRCDACKAVAYQLYTQFGSFNDRHKYLKGNIPESEVLDIFEETCTDVKTFDSYGLKTVGDAHRLSGPGTEAADSPGIMAGGGKWPGRLMDMCEQYMGELGELEIYKAYKKHTKDLSQFQQYLCYGNGMRNECVKSHTDNKKDKRKKQEL